MVATLALVMATGGTAMAALIITSNSQVGQNTISGHSAPSGKHPNLISGSVNGTDLAPSVQSSFTLHCPSGMTRAADLCFDSSVRTSATWVNAFAKCAVLNARLPNASELAEVFDHTGAPQVDQWVEDNFYLTNGHYAQLLEEDVNRSIKFVYAGAAGATSGYRCVVAPSN